MALLVTSACIVAGLLIAIACATTYACRILLQETRDSLKVLNVTVFGLEARVEADIRQARESADAAVAEIVALKEAMQKEDAPRRAPAGLSALEGMGKFGRALAARELFAKAEQDSLDEVNRRG